MFSNCLTIAWRQLGKNKLYAGINIAGLTLGLAVFIFGTLATRYELNHDTFFANHERIYTVGSLISPNSGVGVAETNGVYSALGPLAEAEIDGLDAVARTVWHEFLLSVGDTHLYQTLRFADPALLQIFDFQYLEGGPDALLNPAGVLLSKSNAEQLFGPGPALGKTLTLNHEHTLEVTAVIAELPRNTHFSSFTAGEMEVQAIAPLAALNRAIDYDLTGNYSNLSSRDFTYLLLAQGKSPAELQTQLDAVFDRHTPEDARNFIDGVRLRPLHEANIIMWDAFGVPVLQSIQLLGLLVLIVAIVNYTNLATAQSLGRAREVGLRKTMGASTRQLLSQFLVESTAVAAIAMVFALALLELAIPLYNTALAKDIGLDYTTLLPWLVITTVLVGVVAGAYPAWIITRASPIQALREAQQLRAGSGAFRSVMLGLQFAISVFMLAMVMVVILQNEKVKDEADIYPRGQLLVLKSLEKGDIADSLDTLRNEILRLPGVEQVSYSSLVPFEQSSQSSDLGKVKGDRNSAFAMNTVRVDTHFFATYDIPLLAGRHFDEAIANDTRREDVLQANVIINALAARELGFEQPEQALGSHIYNYPEVSEPYTYTVVGVSEDQNFRGFYNDTNPTVFIVSPEDYRVASVRVTGASLGDTLAALEQTWRAVIPSYPLQAELLDDIFLRSYNFYQAMASVLSGFAGVAMALSTVGLFGLAAFMAQARTREIGLRKVMGARVPQIVRLMVWQFSRPVMWALPIALPACWLASTNYLNFFSNRIEGTAAIIALAGVLALFFAWAVVAIHALRVARASPVTALRYE